MHAVDHSAAVASGSYGCNRRRANLGDRRAWHVAAGETWEGIAMKVAGSRLSVRLPDFRTGVAITLFLSGVVGSTGALADDDDINFRPGNLLVSRSVYDNNPANVVP